MKKNNKIENVNLNNLIKRSKKILENSNDLLSRINSNEVDEGFYHIIEVLQELIFRTFTMLHGCLYYKKYRMTIEECKLRLYLNWDYLYSEIKVKEFILLDQQLNAILKKYEENKKLQTSIRNLLSEFEQLKTINNSYPSLDKLNKILDKVTNNEVNSAEALKKIFKEGQDYTSLKALISNVDGKLDKHINKEKS